MKKIITKEQCDGVINTLMDTAVPANVLKAINNLFVNLAVLVEPKTEPEEKTDDPRNGTTG